jgi:hypothetical protein
MTADITRDTHRPSLGYSSVRLQQGRVQIDADWNEAEDIALRRDRVAARDIVGPSGVPEEAPGFALIPADPDAQGRGTDLLLGYGRAYVDGVLVENPAPPPSVLTPVTDATGTFLVQSGPVPSVGQWLVGPGVPPAKVTARPAPVAADGGLSRVVLAPAPAAASNARLNMTIAPSLLAQPDATGDPTPGGDNLFGLLLEVSERDVTALDDPALRETALGGPDTATRRKVTWRVVAEADGTTCKSYPPDFTLEGTPRARLAARGVPASSTDDPCLTPDPGGYRGVDNRLYRVEVHRGGQVSGGQVRVVWSRDNATHRTRFTKTAGRLRVDSLGRDDATALDQGQWVELHAEAAWRAGLPGHMVRLGEVNGNEIAIAEIRDPTSNAALVEADGSPSVTALPEAGLLRRWEGGAPVTVTAGTPVTLEAGIEVTLDEGALRPGDAWIIPARALPADVEWPRDPASNNPLAIPPPVVARRYMALGIVERIGGRFLPRFDCRRIFPPLTSLISFQMLGGDGQEAMPDLRAGQTETFVPLAAPLRVGVSRGTTPLPGRLVRFTTADSPNPGRLAPVPGTPAARVITNADSALIIATDAAGVAEAQFSIQGLRTAYAVEARLLDATDPAIAAPENLPIRFFAASEVAAEVAFNPANCLFQRATPGETQAANTVQQAIDRLCPAILLVPLGGDGQTATAGEALPAPLRVGLIWGGKPLGGIAVTFEQIGGDASVQPAIATTGPDGVASVTLTAGTNTQLNGGVIRVAVRAPNLPAGTSTWPAELVFTARFGARASPPRLRPIEILSLAGPAPMAATSRLTPNQTAEGFLVRLDGPIAPEVGRFDFTGEVWVDVPAQQVVGTPLGGIAYRTDGRLLREDPIAGKEDALRWVFSPEAERWLTGTLPTLMAQHKRTDVTARLIIHGGGVFGGSRDAPIWLDGGLLFRGDRAEPVLPGGHGTPGSVLTLPFRIVAENQAPQPGFVLVPVLSNTVMAALNQRGLALLAQVFDLAVDRAALGRIAGVTFTGTTRNLTEAKRLIDGQRNTVLLPLPPGQPLITFLRDAQQPLFGAITQQITPAGVPLGAENLGTVSPQDFARVLGRVPNGGPAFVFGEVAFVAEVQSLLPGRLGEPLLTL